MDAAPRRSPPFRRGTRAYVLHYLRGRAPAFAALLLLVTAAACCAVAVQYTMKLLVDAVAAGPRDDNPAVWWALYLFIGLIVAEGLLQRLSGWLGCRTTVALGIDVRLDLFDHLNGQPMRYFADTLAGSLGSRITTTAGSFAALATTAAWRILPPIIDFVGALIVFATVDPRMMAALAAFAALITIGLIRYGERGRPHHRLYATQAGLVGGELIDVITNMWSVKAFSARERERARPPAPPRRPARAHRPRPCSDPGYGAS